MSERVQTNIIVSPDEVCVFGQVMDRPAFISPSQWMDYWEYMDRIQYEGEETDE